MSGILHENSKQELKQKEGRKREFRFRVRDRRKEGLEVPRDHLVHLKLQIVWSQSRVTELRDSEVK